MRKLLLFTAIVFAAGMLRSYAQHSDTLHPVADVFVYTWGGGQGGNAYLKFDISSLPANMVVSNAKLEVNVFARVLPWDDDVKLINLNNQTWVEGDNGDMLWNSSKSDTIIQLSNFATALGWASSTNITPIFLRDYNQSHSFCTVLLKDPDDGTSGPQSGIPATDLNDSIIVGNIIGGFNGYIMFRPREYSDQSKIPRFIIDYVIAPKVTIQPLSTTSCEGDSITFNVTATGDPTLLYQWQKNGTDVNGATLNTYTINPATPADAGNYRCIIANAFGADTSDIAIFTVNSINVTLSSSGPSACSSCDGSISANVTGGTPPYNYLWNTIPVQNTQTAVILCPGYYCVTVTDAYGCTTSSCIILNDFLPPVIISLFCSDPDTTICAGDCITFTTQLLGGIVNYDFYVNGAIIQTGSSNIFTTCSLNDSDVVDVHRTDMIGCKGISPSITVTVFPLPTEFNVTGGGTFCSGGAGAVVGLSASDPSVTYQLQCNGVDVGGALAGTGSALSFGYLTTECCYTVIATNAATFCSDTMNGNACVTIIPSPVVTAAATPDSLCEGDYSTLSASGGISYLWSSPGTYVCPVTTTTYYVTAIASNGCTASDSVVVFVDPCTGISEYHNDVNILFIPNPFSSSAQILSNKNLNDAELNVYDVFGNEVKYLKDISGNTINIYRQDLPDGMYFYKLSEKTITIASGKFILN